VRLAQASDRFSMDGDGKFGSGESGMPSWRGSANAEEDRARRGSDRLPSGDLSDAKLSMYESIPELLRSRSAQHELSGLERGPLIGRGCGPGAARGGAGRARPRAARTRACLPSACHGILITWSVTWAS
jgi:hypothetical protein